MSKNKTVFTMFIFQIIGIALNKGRNWEGPMEVGWGIWTGLIFCVSGGIGLIGATRPSKQT